MADTVVKDGAVTVAGPVHGVSEQRARRQGSASRLRHGVGSTSPPDPGQPRSGEEQEARTGSHGSGGDRRRARTSQAEPLLRLGASAKSFGTVQALTDVDLDIPAGQVTALAGDNGAGKSVLIKCIAGIHAPDDGRDVVGRPAGAHPHAERRGRARASRPSTRTSRCATTSTSSRTCSWAASGHRRGAPWTRTRWSAPRPRRLRPRGDHGSLDPPAGRFAVGRAAPVGRDRQGSAVELEAGDHGRAHRRARGRADARWFWISSAASPTAGSPS